MHQFRQVRVPLHVQVTVIREGIKCRARRATVCGPRRAELVGPNCEVRIGGIAGNRSSEGRGDSEERKDKVLDEHDVCIEKKIV
jgi:hypothetical protein